MIKKLFIRRRENYNDVETIEGLQQRSRQMEEWFYIKMKRYYDDKFNEVFFDKDRKQEIFQTAFLKLWTEIDNRRICLKDGIVCRQQRDGTYKPMSCNLQTFMMAFAKNEYRELMRSVKEEYVADLYDDSETATQAILEFNSEADMEEQKRRIVDECILRMSPGCVEILTLFYYEHKSLDEIIELRKEKNTSKNGLKTAKNKCMNTLKERVGAEMTRFHIAI